MTLKARLLSAQWDGPRKADGTLVNLLHGGGMFRPQPTTRSRNGEASAAA